jgi:hypothetical protein
MHLHPEHSEKHFTASDTVRDVVVGMSDGLTVPFALAGRGSRPRDTAVSQFPRDPRNWGCGVVAVVSRSELSQQRWVTSKRVGPGMQRPGP